MYARLMRRNLFLFFGFLLLFSKQSLACIGSGLEFQAEAILVKPNVKYNLGKLEKINGLKYEKLSDPSVAPREKFAYLSHYDNNVGVIVTEDNLTSDKYGDPSETCKPYKNQKYFDIFIVVPHKIIREENQVYAEPLVNIDIKNFDFNKAMKTELDWLRENEVLINLSDSDIEEISRRAVSGRAGLNSRVVYIDYITSCDGGVQSCGGSGIDPQIFLKLITTRE